MSNTPSPPLSTTVTLTYPDGSQVWQSPFDPHRWYAWDHAGRWVGWSGGAPAVYPDAAAAALALQALGEGPASGEPKRSES